MVVYVRSQPIVVVVIVSLLQTALNAVGAKIKRMVAATDDTDEYG
jgi:hypothetical protein